MKRIFLNLSAAGTLAVAVALTACNNAEEVKKQTDEQNAKIQSLVDEKLNTLQEQVNTECAAKVDSLANEAFAAWQAESSKKGGKKVAPKPAPKPKEEAKKEPEKPKDNKLDIGQKGNENQKKVDVGQKGGENTNNKKINVGQK